MRMTKEERTSVEERRANPCMDPFKLTTTDYLIAECDRAMLLDHIYELENQRPTQSQQPDWNPEP